ncbi:MAG: hypothetical protein WCI18_04185 [Pseudomonadota bacterium]
MKLHLLILLAFGTLARGGDLLPMVTASQSLEVVRESITGIFPTKSELLLFSAKTNEFVKSPLNLNGTNRLEKFGKMTDFRRITVADASPKSNFVGAFETEKGLILIDGRDLMVYRLNPEGKVLAQSGLIWDRLLPFKDAIGEAPKVEQRALKDSFLKELRNSELKIKSLAFIQKNSRDLEFFALTASERVPLVKLSCKVESPTYCEVHRECKIPKSISHNKSLRGLAYDAKTSEIVLGNSSTHSLYVFKEGKCDGSQSYKNIALDEKYKPVSSLFIDSSSRLWIGTETRDDYLNASVFIHNKWN